VLAYLPVYRIEGNPDSGKKKLRLLWTATHPGARFPGEWHESPERAEASAKAFSGFLARAGTGAVLSPGEVRPSDE
jgi:hypothetical protein